MAGRPRMDDGLTVLWALKVSRSLAAECDRRRGPLSRADWTRALMAAPDHSGLAEENARLRRLVGTLESALEEAESRWQDEPQETCPHPAESTEGTFCHLCRRDLD